MSNQAIEKPQITEEEKKNISIVCLSEFPMVMDENDVPSAAINAMSDARVNVSLATPLLAYLMFQCKFHWSDDPRIQTAAAMPYKGENHLFFNPHFFMNRLRNTEQRAFVILHELLHIFLEHCGRATDQGYHMMLWNIATDYVINLSAAGAYKTEDMSSVEIARRYKLYMEKPDFVLYDERFINMTSDEVYHLLLEENDQDAEKAAQAHGGGGNPGEGSEGGGGNENGQMPLDGVSQTSGGKEQVMKNRRSAAAAVSNASSTRSIGEGEGGLVHTLHEMTKPVVDWREQLEEAVQVSTKERYTYNRLSRREGDGGVVFPSMTGKRINVVFGFDSSGSMGVDDYNDVVGELSGILDQFDGWELELVSCDTVAEVLGHYSSEDGDDIRTMNLATHAGGGTDMEPIISHANDLVDQGEELNACIVVTDGYIPTDSVDHACSDEIMNIFVVTRNGNKHLQLENAKVIQMADER